MLATKIRIRLLREAIAILSMAPKYYMTVFLSRGSVVGRCLDEDIDA